MRVSAARKNGLKSIRAHKQHAPFRCYIELVEGMSLVTQQRAAPEVMEAKELGIMVGHRHVMGDELGIKKISTEIQEISTEISTGVLYDVFMVVNVV